MNTKNLFDPEIREFVQETNLTRKITLDGVTKAYPVFKVRLDLLYYNDQNDRIATWISQYKGEHGDDAFERLSREDYNSVIESFIIKSNPAAIEKTKNNIELVSQREPGVVLIDGRIIDGNRRFTCLRKLADKDDKFNCFETVILEKDIEHSKKQIKMLELEIQHGEEAKVEYNPMDRLVGVYQDIVDTGLLTIEEYAEATNESKAEVKRRIEQANLMIEFLEFINMPKQYYVARDYQLGSIMPEIPKILKRCESEEIRQQTKELIFTNLMMKSADDNARYIREIGKMMDNGFFVAYLKEQNRIRGDIQERLEDDQPETLYELKAFVKKNEDIADELKVSKEKSLLKSKKKETRNRPSQIISKSINMLRDVDTNIFEKLTDSEKEKLKTQVNKLVTVADRFDTMVTDEDGIEIDTTKPGTVKEIEREQEKMNQSVFSPGIIKVEAPDIVCLDILKQISNLGFKLDFSAIKLPGTTEDSCEYEIIFVDKDFNLMSDPCEVEVSVEVVSEVNFQLYSKASLCKELFMLIKYAKDDYASVLKMIPFKTNFAFAADFDF